MDNFIPVLRFAVVSDIHYEDAPTVERERFEKAVCSAYAIAEGSAQYNKIDALYVVGDFATSGSEIQMNAFRASAKKTLREGTILTLTMASHEFNERNGGEAAALEKFGRIFGMQPDTHKIINGFHFIAVTTTRGCHFSDEKKAWISEQLKIAAADDAKKPIFFFQHPHISGTVYGSANWGEDEITPILMNYPQIIDFSGHSHAPINDPRSIHQRHFTCLGTGTLSYFELDEFDKIYGTCPPNDDNAAQMLIVEADEAGRVRVYPYDVLTGNFFPCTWKIDTPWDADSFIYTDEIRYKNAVKPYFDDGADITVSDITKNACTISFAQAKIEKEYVNSYDITVRYADSGLTAKRLSVWSEYYFYNMPERLAQEISDLAPDTEYTVEIRANGFWHTKSDNTLSADFKTN